MSGSVSFRTLIAGLVVALGAMSLTHVVIAQ